MRRILDIAQKDLLQILRDRKTFLFLLIMPVAFTFLFGFAFGGFSKGEADPRLPVALINDDGGDMSLDLVGTLERSEVILLMQDARTVTVNYEEDLQKGEIAGILLIPAGWSQSIYSGNPIRLELTADLSRSAGTTVQNEILAAAVRLNSAVQIGLIAGQASSAFYPAYMQARAAWAEAPIQIQVTSAQLQGEQTPSSQVASLAHTSPGMILQFAIAGLLTCATIIVNERKTRSLQRLLTTSASRPQILFGHFLAIFVLIFSQFALLITFGQFILKVDYFRLPAATLLVALAASLCISAMGLLIGVLAKNEEQAIAFSLIPMFIFAGLGGAWTPLEFTSPTFQAIGHLTPIAWAMDGFKNITVRMLGVDAVLLPALALAGFGVLFLLLAAWRFARVSE